jgi:hypothetical protein
LSGAKRGGLFTIAREQGEETHPGSAATLCTSGAGAPEPLPRIALLVSEGI